MPRIQPFVIAIWCGESKPSSISDYLNLFVTELNDILRHGVIVEKHMIRIVIRSFICDSPARSFLKGISKSHSEVMFT